MVLKPAKRWENAPKAKPQDIERSLEIEKIKQKFKKESRKIINMWEGDPVIFGHVNQSLSEYLVEAAKNGFHMYLEMSGCLNMLKESISKFEKRHRDGTYFPNDIIVAPGVSGCFAVIHDTLLDSGDEIVALEPAHYMGGPTSYFYKYGAKCIGSPCIEKDGWNPDFDKLRECITDKTKAITIVSPNNPCGTIYSYKTLKSIIDIAGEYDIPIISDEIYGLLTFDGRESISAATLAGDVPIIVMNGIAKIFQRTGWGIGYICFHDPDGKIDEVKETAKKIVNLYGHYIGRKATPIIYAAAKAFECNLDSAEKMMSKLKERREYTIKRFNEIEGISCVKPEAALYVFPKVKGIGKIWKTDEDFIHDMIKEEGVRFIPGNNFGPSGNGHFRSLLLPDMEILDDVYNRLDRFMKRHISDVNM